MTRIKIASTMVLSVLLLGAPLSVFAALNPAAPGLPTAQYVSTSNKYANNGFSSMCVDCHTRNPEGGATNKGSHFVSVGHTARTSDNTATRTGGGWGAGGATGDTQAGPRYNSAYLRIQPWGGTAPSKYGRVADNVSVSYNNTGNRTGAVDTNLANYDSFEMICESCHNILKNWEGGNNLLAKIPTQDNATSDFCNNCHGHMYSDAAANASANGTKYGLYLKDSGGVRGVNTAHYINGVKYNMNHHVTTQDVVNNVTVGAGLAWRDTTNIDVPAYITSASSASTIGQMPQLGTWVTDGSTAYINKVKTAPAINCVNCHMPGHGGWQYTGGSILRDGSTISGQYVPTTGLERLGENRGDGTARSWVDFDDKHYCSDCHTIAAPK